MVKPSYVRMEKIYGQTRIEDRVYLGFEKQQEELRETIAYFESKKETLLDVIESFGLLSNGQRKQMQKYYLSFFENVHSINFVTR